MHANIHVFIKPFTTHAYITLKTAYTAHMRIISSAFIFYEIS